MRHAASNAFRHAGRNARRVATEPEQTPDTRHQNPYLPLTADPSATHCPALTTDRDFEPRKELIQQ